MAVHGEGLVGQHDRAPDLDVFVVELGEALGGGLLRMDDACSCKEKDALRRDEDLIFRCDMISWILRWGECSKRPFWAEVAFGGKGASYRERKE